MIIHLHLSGADRDDIVTGLHCIAQDVSQLRDAPAQGAARIVRHLPKHLAQALSPLRTAGDSQKRQERTGLAGRRQRYFLAVAKDREASKHPDLAFQVLTRRSAAHQTFRLINVDYPLRDASCRCLRNISTPTYTLASTALRQCPRWRTNSPFGPKMRKGNDDDCGYHPGNAGGHEDAGACERSPDVR